MSNEKKIDTYQLSQELKEGIKNFMTSEKYKNFLDFCSTLHDYSLRNKLLIYNQYPKATVVGSYSFWKQNERQVKRGERGIGILAPIFEKVKGEHIKELPDGTQKVEFEEELKLVSFRQVYVFDIEQTVGKPIPSPLSNFKTTKENEAIFLKKIIENISNIPIIASSKENLYPANGSYNPTEKKILYREDLSSSQQLKTILHELAHSRLHQNHEYATSKNKCEIEAESAAYIVCKHFEIDTSEYSFGYISSWAIGKDIDTYENSLKISTSISKQIIKEIYDGIENFEKNNIKKELAYNLFKPNTNLVNSIHKIYKKFEINSLQELKNLDLKKDKLYLDTINELKMQESMRNQNNKIMILER